MRTSPGKNKRHPKSPPKKKVISKYMQEKLAITILVIMLALFALVFRLYNIINSDQELYNQRVLSQQDYDSRVIPYRRGDIVDRHGTVLATTDKVYNLILDPSQILYSQQAQQEYLEPTIAALGSVFGYDIAELRSLITENSGKYYIRYARQLTSEQKEAFQVLESETNKKNLTAGSKQRIKGVWFEEEFKRIYPYNSLACNVVGFATSDGGTGTGGIEQFYNSSLIGSNGREYGYLNDDSNLERVLKSPVNGSKIVSTIDVNIQKTVEKHINEWIADAPDAEPGAEHIGVVVMDPRNGEILAMASDQQFDLNDPRAVSNRFTADELKAFGEAEARDTWNRQNPDDKITIEQVYEHYSTEEINSFGVQVAWNRVWRNYAVNDTFEPGSPSKIFTVAAGLEEGILDGSETYVCDGFQEVGGHTIQCVNIYGHGLLNLQETLMQSCNDAMMQIAAVEGRERFAKYLRLFGFGSKTGIDLPGEADASLLMYTAENMKSSDLATNSFGQNYNCSMVQMAAAYSSVINGGSYYQPHVVREIENEEGAVIAKADQILIRETVSESTSNYIKQALLRTVNEGTGSAAAVAGYDIAGKTGTAEMLPRGTRDYLVSFCGFAPAMEPEVLVYVVIDRPHVSDQPHSRFASDLFQKIMKDILPYLNVFPNIEMESMPEDTVSQLPEEEGITEIGSETMEETAAKVYETEEYIDPEGQTDSGIPSDVPGLPEGPEADLPAAAAGADTSPAAESDSEDKRAEASVAEGDSGDGRTAATTAEDGGEEGAASATAAEGDGEEGIVSRPLKESETAAADETS